MEHWQFLIQKQGDRSWHTLESPHIQLLEGRYRVLARSNLLNTDVEVRVTHSSTQEVPPKRRIQKQSRRTNSEGLMAVIPFTNFKSGIWEIRCSGDLMSDILGKSWQYSLHLQVLSELPIREVGKLTGGDNVESNSLDFFMLQLPYQQSSREPERITGTKLLSNTTTDIIIPTGTETNTPSVSFTSELHHELALSADAHTNISTPEEITDRDVVTREELSLTSDRTSSTTEEITDSDVVAYEELSLAIDRTSSATEEITDSDVDVVTSEELSLASDRTSSTAEEITDSDVVTSEELSLTSDRTSSFTEEITDSDVVTSEELALASDRTSSNPTEEATDSNLVPRELPSEELDLASNSTLSTSTEETIDSNVVPRELPSEELDLASNSTLSTSTEETIDSNVVTNEWNTEQEYAIIEQPVSPVWLKGETAEQILQNLMDLALPSEELLLEDEEFEEDSIIQPAPPLLLTLEQENYIARWGQGLSINGRVELQLNTVDDESQYATTLYALEVRIELRSPLSSEILAQVRQPLAENLLPLTIHSAINIPVECESKLLLGELSLYGALTDFGEVMLLASRSFTIMADVTELLAITAIAKSSQQNFLANGALSTSVLNQESEASVSLGLELFNLVKASPNQLQTILPSPNQPLPPQINLLSFKKSELGDLRSPQLPKLPAIQTSAIAFSDLMAEVPLQEQEESEQKDEECIPAPTTVPLAPINLEQLAIKNRRSIQENTFPYLKRLKTLPTETTEVTANVADESEISLAEDSPQLSPITELPSNVADESEISLTEDSPQLAPTDAEYENLVEDVELPDDSVAEILASPIAETVVEPVPEVAKPPSLAFSDNSITKPAVPINSQLIGEGNPYSSPLIRKWMQSQGYFVPEPPPPPVQYLSQETENSDSEPQNTFVDEEPLESNLEMSTVDTDLWSEPDVTSEMSLDTEVSVSEENLGSELWGDSEVSVSEENLGSELWGDSETMIITEEPEDLQVSAESPTENLPQEVSTSSLQLPQLALNQKIKIPRAWLAQEIVVDDTDSESEEGVTENLPVVQKQPAISPVSSSLAMDGENIKPLPIPQLHIPEGELVAGQSVRVRVELPETLPQVVVKLWIEDCQTRGLLDGPHLLKDLLPNRSGGMEVMTQINIPFGCVEIRLEAIAFNTSTQQESHKVTVLRTVIPPDLPNLQVDELLGM
ncbi:hypothetical protein [Nostoc sp. FACHB-145]|uniref:hypothetical protein n=1 Tax=Nostoc sp. FACHB-145 TaxID=2692836 RepID=UPI0037CB9F08